MSINLGQKILDIATSDGPTWAIDGNKILLVWKGEGTDSGIYYSTTTALKPNAASSQYSWTPQQKIPNVGTSKGPALANLKGVIYLVWKGEGTDEAIYLSTRHDSGDWAPQQKVPGVSGTSSGPALAVTNDTLYLGWKKEQGSSEILWSTSANGKKWSPEAIIAGVGTSNGPALASDGKGAMYMAWKGVNDSFIWWSKCSDGKTWAPQQKGPGGAFAGPSLAVDGDTAKWLAWPCSVSNSIPEAEAAIPILVPGVAFSYLIDEPSNQWSPAASRLGASTQLRPTLVSTGADRADLMLAWNSPGANDIYDIYYAPLLLPDQELTFAIQSIGVKMMRSGTVFGKTSSDTDYVSIGIKVQGQPAVSKTVFAGELTGGEYGVTLNIPGIKVADTESIYFHYAVLNSSAGLSAVTTFLEKAATQVLNALEKADEIAIGTLTGLPLSMLSPQEAGALMGAQLASIVGLSNLIVPGLGVVIGALVGWFADDIWSAFCPNCDGPVACGAYSFSAPQVRNTLAGYKGVYAQPDENPGVTSAGGCGQNSDYQVVWEVQG